METLASGAKKLLEDGSDNPSAYRLSINANASILDKLSLHLVSQAGSVAAKLGELLVAQTNGATITLPAVAADGAVGVICPHGVASITVKAAAAAKIYGDFLDGVASCVLATNQHLILRSDGTNWFIVAGEPKREEKYGAPVAREAKAAIILSATRMAHVIVTEGEATVTELKCGGVNMGNPETGRLSFFVNPGEAIESNGSSGAKTYKTQHRLL